MRSSLSWGQAFDKLPLELKSRRIYSFGIQWTAALSDTMDRRLGVCRDPDLRYQTFWLLHLLTPTLEYHGGKEGSVYSPRSEAPCLDSLFCLSGPGPGLCWMGLSWR